MSVVELASELEDLLGSVGVSVDERVRRTASTDWAHMSPVLSAKLPAGLADVVAFPRTPEELARVLQAAYRRRVPVTPRGKGTGNYGQAIPLADGLVIDLTRCRRILEIGDGYMKAEAGATFVVMEAAAHRAGQDVCVFPSTVGSTVGGFISGGSGGTGSVEHGRTWDGNILALDVVPCTEDADLLARKGFEETLPFCHAFGTSGIVATATVRLAPARQWTALFTSFEHFADAVEAGRQIMALDPPPRLLSIDDPGLVEHYGDPAAMPLGKVSLRAIIDTSVVSDAGAVVTAAGGTVEEVRPKGAGLLTSLSFNHSTYRLRKARPEFTHLQVGGAGLVERTREAREVLPETLLHLDGVQGPSYAGMLMCRYDGEAALLAGIRGLEGLGVTVSSPHTWELHHDRVGLIRSTAARLDPAGLLNPGKLPAA
ncbi:FAD-binding oxidoreductase [Actinopolymorpha alba]|uniref:FAD-binding oxidoreductase n=1 Tax=Actinopolymorpha alba TaxID=533267 RepID=UPI000374DE8C|nr:FAD-binding oxidoreductase [Actinopolymorpha alba]